ncbi:head GIN domain-containing protein [Flavobacterium branchiarum]|uniref:Head GIN domain-containing protein n=1 Tax=Flavobacterium branchiarum TaxID=1114870 RepID=A0ABV5FNB1_9FLAO|nr:head GIN domain-containing protein [Flavobacterium branchiarum]MDN3672125.1 head GIN domain-containing protein [Flavobacterium branchiarum]
MIKIIICVTKFIVVAITALLFASCNFSNSLKSIEGSGNVSTEKRNIEGTFENVSVSNAIDLVIEQSDKTEVTVEADDNLINKITTKIEGNTLVIKCSYNSFRNIKSKKVIVKMPVINNIKASSASTVKSINILRGEDISLDASSAAEINVNVESDAVTCETSSASNIAIEGKALTLNVSASSGSDIDAKRMLANEIDAQASSGASIAVHPIVSLKAKASSGGDIIYNSIPKSIEKKSSSGGSIEQE